MTKGRSGCSRCGLKLDLLPGQEGEECQREGHVNQPQASLVTDSKSSSCY